MKKLMIVLGIMLMVVALNAQNVTISGTQNKGNAGKNAELKSTPVKITKDMKIITATGDLLSGEAATFTITVTVLPTNITDIFSNTVTMDGEDTSGNVLEQVSDVEDISFNNYANIDVDIRQLGSTTNNGDGTYTITYEMQAFNDGTTDISGVTLTDSLLDVFPGGIATINSLTIDSEVGPLTGSVTTDTVEATGGLLVAKATQWYTQ